jgi:uncharacterized protein DUF6011
MNPIFYCNDAKLHTVMGEPTFRMASSEQLRMHSDNLEAINADKIMSRFGPDPEPSDDPEMADCNFWQSACHSMLEEEDRWRQFNIVWSWIDERPVWLSAVDWYVEVLPDPEREVKRSFRLSLLGGGQVTVLEHFKPWRSEPTSKVHFSCTHPDLRVTTDAGDGLKRFTGIIDGIFCEMSPKAVLFLPGTPQSVADRVAATFRLLTFKEGVGTTCRGPDRDNFMALLDRGKQCCVCGRALRDHVSTLLGIGPDCAKQMRLPHGLEAANRIMRRRKELLGETVNQMETAS